MADVEAVAAEICRVFTAEVEKCEFDQVVGETDAAVDVEAASQKAAWNLGQMGLLA